MKIVYRHKFLSQVFKKQREIYHFLAWSLHMNYCFYLLKVGTK